MNPHSKHLIILNSLWHDGKNNHNVMDKEKNTRGIRLIVATVQFYFGKNVQPSTAHCSIDMARFTQVLGPWLVKANKSWPHTRWAPHHVSGVSPYQPERNPQSPTANREMSSWHFPSPNTTHTHHCTETNTASNCSLTTWTTRKPLQPHLQGVGL